jgi:Holliday junction resolvasome RuvABC endonuclease subunit
MHLRKPTLGTAGKVTDENVSVVRGESAVLLRRIGLEGGKVNILAIDPGPVESAYVIFDVTRKEIISKEIIPNYNLLSRLSEADFDRIAIEMVASYGMPVGKDIFETCVWIGRFIQTSAFEGFPVHLIYRKDVKMALCGNLRAKDANIRQALLDMLGKEKTKGVHKDMWSALAVAMTYIQTHHKTEEACKIAEDAGL